MMRSVRKRGRLSFGIEPQETGSGTDSSLVTGGTRTVSRGRP